MNSRMKLIRADSSQELLSTLASIDISVPLRTEGRTKEHCEQWSICRFIASFADSKMLTFPLSISHRDKPDFLLKLGSKMVGIEVTEAVPENNAAIDAYREHKEIDGPFFLKHHLPSAAQLHVADLRREANSNDPGDGWGGDSVEREWAFAMKAFIRGKIEKSRKLDFELFESNWLLMYDNWPLPALNQAGAAKRLFETLAPEDYVPFENIFIECSNRFWAFLCNAYYSRPINDLWADS